MIWEASAPGRCGIVGNPSDIYGGFVVSCSAPARATCRLEVGRGGDMPTDRTLWDAATARFPIREPVSVHWQSDIPRSSGLAGSTALLAATLVCVLAARGETPDLESQASRQDFAELVRDVERHEANVMCGYQDATMVVHGGLQAMDFAGKHPVQAGPRARTDLLECATELPFLLVTTGVQRLSGSVHGPMSDRWLAGETDVVDKMARLSELGRMGRSAILAQDWAGLAGLMTENQEIMASLGGSGEAIDALISDCVSSGALAAKLAGAGLGGTVIALADDADVLERELRHRGRGQFMRPNVQPGLTLRRLA